MRTKPTAAAEVETWLTVLIREGHLHHAESGPDTTWTVHRHSHSRPWTLHHPVLAMDFVEEVLREVQQQDADPGR